MHAAMAFLRRCRRRSPRADCRSNFWVTLIRRLRSTDSTSRDAYSTRSSASPSKAPREIAEIWLPPRFLYCSQKKVAISDKPADVQLLERRKPFERELPKH